MLKSYACSAINYTHSESTNFTEQGTYCSLRESFLCHADFILTQSDLFLIRIKVRR